MSGNGLSDAVFEAFDRLGENKDHSDAAGRLLLISLDKLLKDWNECHAKIKQLPDTVKNNNELGDKVDRLQIQINGLTGGLGWSVGDGDQGEGT